MAKGMTVVVPPQAADMVPERKSSQVTWPSQGCWSMWQWLSMPPGVTSLPFASMISSAVPRASPKAMMRPPRIPMSQRNTSPAVATRPLRITRSKRWPPLVVDIGELHFAFGDEGRERLGNARIQRRLFVTLQRRLPQLGRALGCRQASGVLPVLVVLPVGDQRLVEGRFVARERMFGAEEMPARRHAGDGLEPFGDLGGVHVHGLDGL